MATITKTYRALILDMDGTLLNSEKVVLDSLAMLAEEYSLQLTPAQYRAGLGCTAENLMTDLGLADPIRAAGRWREIMVGMLDDIPLFDGTEPVLVAPIRRGVVTSQTREELDCNMARLHIAHRFECTVTVDDTPYQKPHPRPLLYCLERMGLSVEDALFVGDSVYDYECALAAGVDFGLATWGAKDIDQFPLAAFQFRSPPDMLAHIRTCSPV